MNVHELPRTPTPATTADGVRPPQRGLSPVELSRLRWRCRRGMLENDLILSRFIDARGATLGGDDLAAFDRLLSLSDHVLWELLSGRSEPADPELVPVLTALRKG